VIHSLRGHDPDYFGGNDALSGDNARNVRTLRKYRCALSGPFERCLPDVIAASPTVGQHRYDNDALTRRTVNHLTSPKIRRMGMRNGGKLLREARGSSGEGRSMVISCRALLRMRGGKTAELHKELSQGMLKRENFRHSRREPAYTQPVGRQGGADSIMGRVRTRKRKESARGRRKASPKSSGKGASSKNEEFTFPSRP